LPGPSSPARLPWLLWQLEVNASISVENARRDLAAGKHRAAARAAWKAVSLALRAQDEASVRGALEVAEQLADTGDDRLRKDAEHLAAYCHALLDGAGGGVQPRTLLETLLMRDPSLKRSRCPLCAEDIAAQARICKHCGHVLTPAEDKPESPSPDPSAPVEDRVVEP
jgi:hypothetical protein